jgi:hypothetical protein
MLDVARGGRRAKYDVRYFREPPTKEREIMVATGCRPMLVNFIIKTIKLLIKTVMYIKVSINDVIKALCDLPFDN